MRGSTVQNQNKNNFAKSESGLNHVDPTIKISYKSKQTYKMGGRTQTKEFVKGRFAPKKPYEHNMLSNWQSHPPFHTPANFFSHSIDRLLCVAKNFEIE